MWRSVQSCCGSGLQGPREALQSECASIGQGEGPGLSGWEAGPLPSSLRTGLRVMLRGSIVER